MVDLYDSEWISGAKDVGALLHCLQHPLQLLILL